MRLKFNFLFYHKMKILKKTHNFAELHKRTYYF